MARWSRTADTLHAAALVSHVACCGAPIALNLAALLFGAGLLSAASPWMEVAHGLLHGREALLLAGSAVLVGLGGLAQYLSWRADCGRNSCGHGSCAPKKPRRLLMFAVVCALFAANVGVYLWHNGGAGSELAVQHHAVEVDAAA